MNPSQSFRFNHHQSIVVVSKIQYTIFSTQKGKLPKIMTMISYTKSTAYGAPSCRPLTGVRGKTPSSATTCANDPQGQDNSSLKARNLSVAFSYGTTSCRPLTGVRGKTP